MNKQSLMSAIEPPEGTERLTAYLRAATEVLGGRTDADLARRIGVPPSTVANWKRRGSIPTEKRRWFQDDLILAVAATSDRHLRTTDIAPISAVIDFLVETQGNPLSSSRDPKFSAAASLPALLNWAQFVSLALSANGRDGGLGSVELAELVKAGALRFKSYPLFASLD